MQTEKRVLIVDDEADVRQALRRGIRQRFNKENTVVSITEASNGQEAIEAANDCPPDLIIMDIRMPIMNGLKACKLLRNDSKFAATKIIILTCEITEESEGLLSGADDYVIKPFDIKTLMIRIERGLFQSFLSSNEPMTDVNGIISKKCFVDTCLYFEIARAQRYQHPLSLLLLKVIPKDNETLDDDKKNYLSKLLTRRASDKVIAWEPNTYAVLLTETGADDATIVAKHIAQNIRNHDDFLRTSMGIANLEDTVGDDIVGNAESSLNESLRTGGIVLNRVTLH